MTGKSWPSFRTISPKHVDFSNLVAPDIATLERKDSIVAGFHLAALKVQTVAKLLEPQDRIEKGIRLKESQTSSILGLYLT
jgi:hypothetical protein